MQIGKLAAIEDGGARGFSVPHLSRKIVVVRRRERVFAYLDACPHYADGTPMAWKTDRYLNGEKTHIACHSHGALFDIETGICVLGPCLGQRLCPIAATIGPSGDIEIECDPALEDLR